MPRVECPEHGVLTVKVPWGEPGSGFTALFEALVIDWLKEASIQAVSRQLKLSWNAIDGIMQRAVSRGMERRKAVSPERIGVDERVTTFGVKSLLLTFQPSQLSFSNLSFRKDISYAPSPAR